MFGVGVGVSVSSLLGVVVTEVGEASEVSLVYPYFLYVCRSCCLISLEMFGVGVGVVGVLSSSAEVTSS